MSPEQAENLRLACAIGVFAIWFLALLAIDWEHDSELCKQHRKPKSQCKDEHRP